MAGWSRSSTPANLTASSYRFSRFRSPWSQHKLAEIYPSPYHAVVPPPQFFSSKVFMIIIFPLLFSPEKVNSPPAKKKKRKISFGINPHKYSDGVVLTVFWPDPSSETMSSERLPAKCHIIDSYREAGMKLWTKDYIWKELGSDPLGSSNVLTEWKNQVSVHQAPPSKAKIKPKASPPWYSVIK